MKQFFIILFAFGISFPSFSQAICGSVLNESFEGSELPSGFTEISTSGHVWINSEKKLVMDYSANPKTSLEIDFDDLSSSVFINFSFQTDRNYFLGYFYLLDSNGDVIGQLVLGNNAVKGICISREIVYSGPSEDFVNMLSSNISTNTDYEVSLEIDTDSRTISGNVIGNDFEEALNIDLFVSSIDNVSSIKIVQEYMYGNESDSDDLRFNYFQVINDSVDRLSLSSSIDQAIELKNNATVGSEPGEYAQEDINDLQAAIDIATSVFEDCSATQTEIDNARDALDNAIYLFRRSEIASVVSISINTTDDHELNEGLAGYNVRIADSPWNYNNEVFRKGVKNANIGFLRYFSGTTGDYFDMNTGMYEPQWYEQVHSTSNESKGWNGFPGLFKWQEGKGPSRLIDLYDLLGENGAKLVITWNGFTDSPDQARNLAKFCKDNDIIVDCWQFCNEPNFYLPDGRYFFNNGADYVRKMKEIADAILSVDPDANLAMSYGWDGWGGFASGIKSYQDSEGAFWNKTSVHSYAVHGAGNNFESAMSSANARVINRTNDAYFDKVDQQSWNNADLLITEYGVWNEYLKGTIYSGLYAGEYLTRMSVHPQAWLIGKHHIGGIALAENNYKDTIWDAWENEYELDADLLPNDYSVSIASVPSLYINPAINNSLAVYSTNSAGGESVPSNQGNVPAIFAASYKGEFDTDYLLIINKSDKLHDVDLEIDGAQLDKSVSYYSIFSHTPDGNHFETDTLQLTGNNLTVMPYSVTRVEWKKDQILAPGAPRIYNIEHGVSEVSLKWWEREGASGYELKYGTSPGQYDQTISVDTNSAVVSGLNAGIQYFFVVTAFNDAGQSEESNEVSTFTGVPETPEINYIHEDNRRITIHWESVPFANGYKVKYGTSEGDYTEELDAKNVSGYVLRWVENDTPYYIAVSAYNNAGEGDNSNEIVATAKNDRPWAPYLLNGSEKSNGSVELSWRASVNDHNSSYAVYYCENPWDTASYELVEDGIENTTYNDITSRNAGRHFYRVKARNETGNSFFYSNIATVWKNQSGNTVNLGDVSAAEVDVFPNPASSYLHVGIGRETIPLEYNIFDMVGKVTLNGKITNISSQRIDLRDLDSGIYFIEFCHEKKKIIKKVIIQSSQ